MTGPYTPHDPTHCRSLTFRGRFDTSQSGCASQSAANLLRQLYPGSGEARANGRGRRQGRDGGGRGAVSRDRARRCGACERCLREEGGRELRQLHLHGSRGQPSTSQTGPKTQCYHRLLTDTCAKAAEVCVCVYTYAFMLCFLTAQLSRVQRVSSKKAAASIHKILKPPENHRPTTSAKTPEHMK